MTHAASPPIVRTLDQQPLHRICTVSRVVTPDDMRDWKPWLEEIGFIQGEKASVVSQGFIGAEPLVVRIGDSVFALRRAEAACVQVEAP